MNKESVNEHTYCLIVSDKTNVQPSKPTPRCLPKASENLSLPSACTHVFLVTLFITISSLNKLWNTCAKGYHSAGRNDGLLARAATWTDLRCIGEGSQTADSTHCMSPFIGRTFGTEHRPAVARSWAGRRSCLQGGTGNSRECCSGSLCVCCDGGSVTAYGRACRGAH